MSLYAIGRNACFLLEPLHNGVYIQLAEVVGGLGLAIVNVNMLLSLQEKFKVRAVQWLVPSFNDGGSLDVKHAELDVDEAVSQLFTDLGHVLKQHGSHLLTVTLSSTHKTLTSYCGSRRRCSCSS